MLVSEWVMLANVFHKSNFNIFKFRAWLMLKKNTTWVRCLQMYFTKLLLYFLRLKTGSCLIKRVQREWCLRLFHKTAIIFFMFQNWLSRHSLLYIHPTCSLPLFLSSFVLLILYFFLREFQHTFLHYFPMVKKGLKRALRDWWLSLSKLSLSKLSLSKLSLSKLSSWKLVFEILVRFEERQIDFSLLFEKTIN